MSAADDARGPRVEIAVAVVEDEGRFLIGRRQPGAPLAGCWEFPGGKINPGETPREAVVRECLEETGLVVRITGSYPAVDHEYEHAAVRLHFFACMAFERQRPLPERFVWVAASELGRFAFPPANRELLAQLIAGKPA